jgi:beta-lactamase superfamily II metal-dependent hydrolase
VVLTEDPPHHGTDENDMSISLLIQYGRFRFFIGGDIHKETEKKIADRDLVFDVDVYKANHHGFHTSSFVEFLNDMKPTVVLFSNGDRTDYQHPRQVTLDTFAATGVCKRAVGRATRAGLICPFCVRISIIDRAGQKNARPC